MKTSFFSIHFFKKYTVQTTVFCCLFFAFMGFTAVAQTPKTANKTTKQAAKTAFEPKYLRRAAEKYKTMMHFDKTNTAEVNAWAAKGGACPPDLANGK